MSVLILACLSHGTGNNSTAIRISNHLSSNGYHTILKCATETKNQFELAEFLNHRRIITVIGIHAYRAGRLLQNCSVPYIIIFGGTDLNEHSKNVVKLDVMNRAVEKARFCVAFNDPMKEKAKSLWPNVKEKIILQAQGVSVLHSEVAFEKDVQSLHKQHQDLLNNNAIIFLLVGGLRPVKDPIFLVDIISAWHMVDERINLIIVGPELDREYSQRCKERISSSSGVILVDGLKPSALWRAMLHATALVNTSVSEGMANSILEAMQLGTPVIARRNEGNVAIIEHGKTGFLFESPQEFRRCAEELLASESLRENIIENAHHYISNHHSLEKESATYCRIMELITSNFD